VTPKRPVGASLSAIVLMVLAMICLAAGDAVGKYLTQDYSIWQVLWIRSWVWLSIATLWISRHGSLRYAFHSALPGLQTVRSLVLVIEIVIFIQAFRLLPLGDVTAIGASTPLIVLLISVVFLDERIGRHRWFAVCAGFAGMMLVARPGFGTDGLLTLLPIAGALLWGTYQALTRRISFQDTEATALLWTGAALFLVTGAIAPFFWTSPGSLGTWALFLAAGLLNTLGHLALISAMHRGEASALQPYSYSQTIAALVIGYAVFQEVPDFWKLVGMIAIVGGGLYALYRERKLAARMTGPPPR